MAEGREVARWTRLGLIGHLLQISGAMLLLLAIVAFRLDSEGENVFLLIVSAIALAGALLAWRFGWWGKALGILAAILPAMALFWTAFGLSAFPSFFDFMPGIMVIPGGLLAAASYIAAIVAGRRQHRTAGATGGERTGIRVALGLVGLVAVITGALTLIGRSTVNADRADETIVSKSFEFEPKKVTVAGGSTIAVRNSDPFFHTFTIDELGIDEKLTAGDQILIEIPDRAGSYVFYCVPHTEPDDPDPESDMAGRLTVEE